MSTHDFGPKFLPRLAGLVTAALLLHAVILGGADWVWPQTAPPPLPAAPLQVRVVAPAPVAVVVETEVAVAIAPAPVTVKGKVAPARQQVSLAPAPQLLPVVSGPVAEPAAVPPVRFVATTQAATEPADTDDEAPPIYRTQLPPAMAMRYDFSRGPLRGTGELAWRPQGGQYALTLDVKLAGITVLSQASTGGIDAAGIAPLRFTDQRARRGTTAANFQRAGDKITYSGSQSEYALKPGAQDRLSWMLQLAAIVAAEPQRGAAGARIVMQVTGSRGDAGLWVFRCIGMRTIEARGGSVDALAFVREPREAYDTTVQVWLDPTRHHLPVQAMQKSGGNDEAFELRLVEVTEVN